MFSVMRTIFVSCDKTTQGLGDSALSLQASLVEAEAGRQKAEEALQAAHAALAACRRKSDTYRRENRALLAKYDDWLKSLVDKRGSEGPLHD